MKTFKTFFFALASTTFCFSAFADTLDNLLASQETVTIKPVEYKGFPVDVKLAGPLCAALRE